jgi:hypothetical protein
VRIAMPHRPIVKFAGGKFTGSRSNKQSILQFLPKTRAM